MPRYETVFILTPVLSEEQAKEAAGKFRKLLTDLGCKIVHEDSWGLSQDQPARVLAAERHTSLGKSVGHYKLFEFLTESAVAIRELDIAFKRDERVLRFMTIKLDEHS